MREHKNFNKLIITFLIITSSMFIFIGCGNNSTSMNPQNQVKKTINKSQVKKDYDNALSTLVSDKTITKEQSNTVVTSLMGTVTSVGKQSKSKQKSILDKLVTNKIITKEQEDKIINTLRLNK